MSNSISRNPVGFGAYTHLGTVVHQSRVNREVKIDPSCQTQDVSPTGTSYVTSDWYQRFFLLPLGQQLHFTHQPSNNRLNIEHAQVTGQHQEIWRAFTEARFVLGELATVIKYSTIGTPLRRERLSRRLDNVSRHDVALPVYRFLQRNPRDPAQAREHLVLPRQYHVDDWNSTQGTHPDIGRVVRETRAAIDHLITVIRHSTIGTPRATERLSRQLGTILRNNVNSPVRRFLGTSPAQ